MRWSWLGDPLALDFVNTVRRRGMRYVELLAQPADLQEWLRLEAGRVDWPHTVDATTLGVVLPLRDRALALLRAAAAGGPLPPDAVAELNAVARQHPTVRLVGATPGSWTHRVIGPADGADALVAQLAAATIDLLTGPDAETITLCDAPGCGQLYQRSRPNQQWCDPHCGARARSERQFRRRRPAAG